MARCLTDWQQRVPGWNKEEKKKTKYICLSCFVRLNFLTAAHAVSGRTSYWMLPQASFKYYRIVYANDKIGHFSISWVAHTHTAHLQSKAGQTMKKISEHISAIQHRVMATAESKPFFFTLIYIIMVHTCSAHLRKQSEMTWIEYNSPTRHMASTHQQFCPEQTMKMPHKTITEMCRRVDRLGKT